MPFVDVNGISLHYRQDGDAALPPLLLSHSLGASIELWDAQMPALTEHFHVLRYDTRGHGQSSVPPGPYTLEQLGGDVVALLTHLGIARTHYLGISMGGLTGQWVALHHPELIDRLVLANTAAEFGSPDTWNARMEKVLDEGVKAIVDGVMSRWLTADFAAANPAIATKIRTMVMATDDEAYAGCCAAVRDADLRGHIAGIEAPTLAIGGTYDLSSPPASTRFLAESIPGARYLELETAHLSNVENPMLSMRRWWGF
ncbi:3-oxoadipate enol-lactonase [Pigmentiphaga aceris]|uniref:3-oxoadipate enol-lactonase n=1 Tax=Pigmentiphaga aceris TaxID=1940612 RepID=UPI00319DC4A1